MRAVGSGATETVTVVVLIARDHGVAVVVVPGSGGLLGSGKEGRIGIIAIIVIIGTAQGLLVARNLGPERGRGHGHGRSGISIGIAVSIRKAWGRTIAIVVDSICLSRGQGHALLG